MIVCVFKMCYAFAEITCCQLLARVVAERPSKWFKLRLNESDIDNTTGITETKSIELIL